MRNPLSLPAFLAWVEKQPAEARYDYYDCDKCALARYAASLGLETPYGVDENKPIHNSAFWQAADDAAIGSFDRNQWTFGALAHRLREQVS